MAASEFVMARNLDPTRSGGGPTAAFPTGSGGTLELSVVVTIGSVFVNVEYSADLANWVIKQTLGSFSPGASFGSVSGISAGYVRLSFAVDFGPVFVNVAKGRIIHQDDECACKTATAGG